MLELIATEHIVIAILAIIIIAVFTINKKIKNKIKEVELKIKKQKRVIDKKEMELTIAQLEVDKVMADTNLEIEKLFSRAKSDLNQMKLKEAGTLERELRKVRDERLKEIEVEAKEKFIKEEGLLEQKIIDKQRELMEFEAELNDILYERELDQKEQIRAIQAAIDNMKSIEEAAVDARRRQYQDENYLEFHSIIIDEDERRQIDRLLDVVFTIPGDKIKEAVNKLIFDYYYKNPVDDLIKRVCEGKKLSGIYKITDKENGMCYIGQSVDIASRWLVHCKRGSGVDAATNNKLYPVMKKKKIFNFTFEIIEITNNLSEQEKYWAEYFKAKIFGYTMKA